MGQGKNSMSAQEKLQRAIQATIAAGYQLNSEAFEFLCQNCETSDPVTIMNLAFERIQELQEKPMFIERGFLEAILQPAIPVPEVQLPELQITPRITSCYGTIRRSQKQLLMKPNSIHTPEIYQQTSKS